jgi:hypothetical protein
MELDRLSLSEVRQVARIIELLGEPASVEECASCIRICQAAETAYRRLLDVVQQSIRAHEGG